jgi:acetyltransferase-like isoleucine patch superfamily enzyme
MSSLKDLIGWHLRRFCRLMGVFRVLQFLGVPSLYYPLIFGDSDRLHTGKQVELSNTLFNTVGGHIFVGDDTFFGHNCMVLTGKHLGRSQSEVVSEGNDIRIGAWCWIALGVIIIGGVTIGDRCLIAAGSVVTHDVPDNTTVKGKY